MHILIWDNTTRFAITQVTNSDAMWHLAAVARCPTLQSFLSPDEQDSATGVLRPTDDAPLSSPAAAAPPVGQADASTPSNEGDSGSFPTSAHLERHVPESRPYTTCHVLSRC